MSGTVGDTVVTTGRRALPSASATRALYREQFLAAVTLVALGVRYPLPHLTPATTDLVAVIVTAPLWMAALIRFRWALLSVASGVVTLFCGLVLTLVAASTHALSHHNLYGTSFLLIEIVAGAGMILWARTLMPAWQVGAIYAVGLLVRAELFPGALGAANALKFDWLVPLAVLVFSLIHRADRVVQLIVCLTFVGLAAVADARAVFGTALITAVLLAWQLRPRFSTRHGSWGWTAAMLASLGFAVYNLASTLLINGYLGAAAQQRSIDQVDRSGSLLLGGRPELSATWALITHFPGGFGPGIIANIPEINVAKAGMVAIRYDPNNGYVNRFMFGSSVELHSTFGDLWAGFGYAGILFSLGIVVLVVVGLAKLVANRRAGALVLFFGVWVFWNMLFSPIASTVPTLLLAIGFILAEFPIRRSVPSSTTDQGQMTAAAGVREATIGDPMRPRAPVDHRPRSASGRA